jgi:hypothetical protein
MNYLTAWHRWTTGYGEKYDYDSIMHYSKLAFSKSTTDLTIVPKYTDPDLVSILCIPISVECFWTDVIMDNVSSKNVGV